MKSKLKQYLVAIIKVYSPLLGLFICNDVFAIDSGVDGLNAMATETTKAAKGGFMPMAVVGAAVGGVGNAIWQQTLGSLAIAVVIIVVAIGLFKFGGAAFTLSM